MGETVGVEQASSDQLKEFAYYYPEPYWLSQESSWIKSLLLFFDGVAILLPDYMSGRELAADPTLAQPLADQGLLKVLQPEWFVDQELADRLAEGMVELIAGDEFDTSERDRAPFAALSMSRMGFAQLSASRMGNRHRGVFEVILQDLKERGLARDSEDGVSIPLRRDVRLAYLLLLAQEARTAGRRQGFDLHPATNGPHARKAVRSFLELSPMPSRQNVIGFDLLTASVDLDPVPLDEVLDFRCRYSTEHRRYMVDLRRFVAEISTADLADRRRLLELRQADLVEQARNLRRLALDAFKRPSNFAGFALALTGAAWALASGDPVAAGLGGLGAAMPLLRGRSTGSAYSYVFRAHRQWP
jgi:hypothetical protein